MDSWFISLLQIKDYGIFLFTLLTAIVSAVLSGLLGLEREMTGQAAGLRTHVIVSVACSLIMSTSIFAIKLVIKDNPDFSSLTYDASRIAAAILGGIGFMGAGAIVKNGFNIRGLTTAATLFFVAAIGMACGSGFVLEATGVTILVLILLMGLVVIEKWLDNKSPMVVITSDYKDDFVNRIKEEIDNHKVLTKDFLAEIKKDENGNDYYEVSICLAFRTNKNSVKDFLNSVRKFEGIRKIEIRKKDKSKTTNVY